MAKSYEVTLRFKYPAWDEKNGVKFDVVADSKREAIKRARREAYDAGHTVGLPANQTFFSAIEVDGNDDLRAKLSAAEQYAGTSALADATIAELRRRLGEKS